MIITNLRFMWYLNTDAKVNLSVGYDTITKVDINNSFSAENGNSQLLKLRAKNGRARYEFKFKTIGISKNKDIFSTFQKICRSYESTRMYRDIKLRGAIVHDK